MFITPAVKRKLVFSNDEEDNDHNLSLTPKMFRESFSSTPLVPKLMDLKPFLGIWLLKTLELSPRSPITPLNDYLGFEVSPFPTLHRRSTVKLYGGEESVVNHRLYSTPNQKGHPETSNGCFASLPKRGVSKEHITPTSPFSDSVIFTDRYPPPRTLIPNPETGESYLGVPNTQSPYSGYQDVPNSQSPYSE